MSKRWTGQKESLLLYPLFDAFKAATFKLERHCDSEAAVTLDSRQELSGIAHDNDACGNHHQQGIANRSLMSYAPRTSSPLSSTE